MGASLRFVKSVKAIYNSVKLCVRSLGKFSDSFDSFVESSRVSRCRRCFSFYFLMICLKNWMLMLMCPLLIIVLLRNFKKNFYYSPMTLYYLQIRYLSYSHCLIKCQFIVRNGILLLILIRLRWYYSNARIGHKILKCSMMDQFLKTFGILYI